jgi:hypothetical protein
LKTEKIFAAGIGCVWRLLAEQPAQIIEVFNVGLRFLAPVAPPLGFEFAGCHIRWRQDCAGTLGASIPGCIELPLSHARSPIASTAVSFHAVETPETGLALRCESKLAR